MAVLVLVGLLLLFAGGSAVVTKVKNGGRVGPATQVGPDGIIRAVPRELAAAAGMEVNAYALARCLVSEHGSDGDVYLRAVAWAVRNKARERGVTVLQLLTEGAGTGGDGYFGEQKAAAGTKYASTRADPLERHAAIAKEVLAAPQAMDPTRGSSHFFSPAAQDALAAKAAAGDKRYAKYAGKTASVVDASWRAGGLEPVVPAGIDARRLTLYRRASA